MLTRFDTDSGELHGNLNLRLRGYRLYKSRRGRRHPSHQSSQGTLEDFTNFPEGLQAWLASLLLTQLKWIMMSVPGLSESHGMPCKSVISVPGVAHFPELTLNIVWELFNPRREEKSLGLERGPPQ